MRAHVNKAHRTNVFGRFFFVKCFHYPPDYSSLQYKTEYLLHCCRLNTNNHLPARHILIHIICMEKKYLKNYLLYDV